MVSISPVAANRTVRAQSRTEVSCGWALRLICVAAFSKKGYAWLRANPDNSVGLAGRLCSYLGWWFSLRESCRSKLDGNALPNPFLLRNAWLFYSRVNLWQTFANRECLERRHHASYRNGANSIFDVIGDNEAGAIRKTKEKILLSVKNRQNGRERFYFVFLEGRTWCAATSA